MIEDIDPTRVLFLDIETVSGQASFDDLEEDFRELWQDKARKIEKRGEGQDPLSDAEIAELYNDRAAIFGEFGKIVCISVGILHRKDDDAPLNLVLKSFYGADEAELLRAFADLLEKKYYDPEDRRDRYAPPHFYFCGHNIKEFDMPYICRRMLVNRLPFPPSLQLAGKKPWELKHLVDTMELWKFGDRKSYTSLHALATVLGFTSPKSEMDGSGVGTAFWEENDLDKIARYCEKDVLATVQLFLRFRLDELIDEEHGVVSRTFATG